MDTSSLKYVDTNKQYHLKVNWTKSQLWLAVWTFAKKEVSWHGVKAEIWLDTRDNYFNYLVAKRVLQS